MYNGTPSFGAPDNSGTARMKVVGVGGGGGNAVNRMIQDNLQGVDFLQMNTDLQVLKQGLAPMKVQLGVQKTRGLGAGARPETGYEAAMESRNEIAIALEGADLVFITCGMGGGTGTGAAPVVAEIARSQGALTIGIVTRPFLFEGRKRMQQAMKGIEEMRKHVDTMIVVPNERLLAVVGTGIPFHEALKKADEVLRQATEGIAGLVNESGLVNVDFADVKTIMQNGGSALMGRGLARGENRAVEAAQQAISSPLLDNMSITGAAGVLVNIVGGESLSLGEVHTINQIVHESVGDDAEIIFGAVQNEALGEDIQVTVIATGFDANRQSPAYPSATSGNVGYGSPSFGGGYGSPSATPAYAAAPAMVAAPAPQPTMPSNVRPAQPAPMQPTATRSYSPTLESATLRTSQAPTASLDLEEIEIPSFSRAEP